MIQLVICILVSIIVVVVLVSLFLMVEVHQLQQDKSDLKNRMYGMAKQKWNE